MLISLTSYAEGKAALDLENPPFQELGTAGMGKSGCWPYLLWGVSPLLRLGLARAHPCLSSALPALLLCGLALTWYKVLRVWEEEERESMRAELGGTERSAE